MKFKKITAFTFLCILSINVSAQADPAKWKKIFENQNYEIFIDPSSVRPIINPQITTKGFTFIDMINFKKVAEDGPLDASITHIASVDCINPGYKSQGGRLLKKHYANSAGEEFTGSPWVDIPKANEQVKMIYKYFCSN